MLDRFDQRFDRIEKTLSNHAERIVKLESAKKRENWKAAGWGGVVAGCLVGVIEIVKLVKL